MTRFWHLRRLCRIWNQGSLYNRLTFSEEAYGFGGLLVTSLVQILDQCDLTNYDICFVQIGENEVKAAKNDMHALINIVEQFHRQGVRRVVFDSLVIPRHHGGYNKRCNRLNNLAAEITCPM